MRPRGKCRECGQDVAITDDQRARVHGPRSLRCPGSGKRPRGRHVTFACLTGSHDTCGGHDGTAAKPCECPDMAHAVTQTNALASWDASTSDPAADLEAAVAIVNDAATASVLVDHPDGALNCEYDRNLEGILECTHGCGRQLPIAMPVVPRQAGKTTAQREWLTDAEAEVIEYPDGVEYEQPPMMALDYTPPAEVHLTDDERCRIIEAHRAQYPDQALEVCQSILEGRLNDHG
jgi:hypothetical protein